MEELESVIEEVAESVHDAWQKERERQGWTFGAVRNDELKQSPAMRPYQELAEEEKELDRSTARATLQALLDLGYTVQKSQDQTG